MMRHTDKLEREGLPPVRSLDLLSVETAFLYLTSKVPSFHKALRTARTET